MKKKYVLGPRWGFLALMLPTAFFCCLGVSGETVLFRGFLVFFLCIIVYLTQSLVLSEEGITVRYMWIPLRKLPWSDITRIEYVAIPYHRGDSLKWYAILFELRNCPRFYKGKRIHPDYVYWYQLIHPLRVLLFPVPKDDQESYLYIVNQFHEVEDFRQVVHRVKKIWEY